MKYFIAYIIMMGWEQIPILAASENHDPEMIKRNNYFGRKGYILTIHTVQDLSYKHRYTISFRHPERKVKTFKCTYNALKFLIDYEQKQTGEQNE